MTGSKEFPLNKTHEPEDLQPSACLASLPLTLTSSARNGGADPGSREGRRGPVAGELLCALTGRCRRRNEDLGPEAAGLSGPVVSPVKWVDVPEEREDRPGQRRPGPALLPARARALVSACLPLFLPLLTVLACMTGYSLRRSLSLKFKTNRLHCVRSGHAGSHFHHLRQVSAVFSVLVSSLYLFRYFALGLLLTLLSCKCAISLFGHKFSVIYFLPACGSTFYSFYFLRAGFFFLIYEVWFMKIFFYYGLFASCVGRDHKDSSIFSYNTS